MEKSKYSHKFTETFKNSFNENPKKTLFMMELCMAELGIEVENKWINKLSPILFDENKLLLVLFIFIALLGIPALGGIMLYIFGFIFFASGFGVGSSKDGEKTTLIFLFSHGLTGLIIMIASLIGFSIKKYLESKFLFVLLGLSVALFICGFIKIIIYNLNGNFKDMIYAKSKCLIFFVLGFLIISILEVIIKLGVI